MSPHFPPMRAPLRSAASPVSVRSVLPRPRAADVERGGARTSFLLARVVVTVAGVAGFLGLLIAAVHASPAQETLRISAFIWFFGFGAVRVALDVRAARASRRPGACSGRGQHGAGGRLR